MSSTTFGELECSFVADEISCQAMTEMAEEEFNKYRQGLAYNIISPACDTLHGFADRNLEHQLQKRPDTHLNKVCFNLPKDYHKGPWTSQFELASPPYEIKFDQRTRPKTN